MLQNIEHVPNKIRAHCTHSQLMISRKLVARHFFCKSEALDKELMTIEGQQSNTDCGLFAIGYVLDVLAERKHRAAS